MKTIIQCEICGLTMDFGMGSTMSIHEQLHNREEVVDGVGQIWVKDKDEKCLYGMTVKNKYDERTSS
jgi:hypothetical protein